MLSSDKPFAPVTASAVLPMREKFRKLVSTRNVEKIRREILKEFGCEVNHRYAAALITFVDEMIKGAKE